MVFLTGITFDRLVLSLRDALPGDPDTSAYSIWHVWWPIFSFNVPDGLTIHAYSGAPYTANHLRYSPILQSFVFSVLARAATPIIGLNLLLLGSFAATWLGMVWYFLSKQIPLWLGIAGASAFVLTGWYYDVLTQADIILASIWLMPLAFLSFDHWLRHQSYWRLLVVIVVLYASVMSGVQHLAWIAGLWLPYVLIHLRAVFQNTDADLSNLQRQIIVMGVIGAILLFVYPMPSFVRAMQGYAPAFTPAADPPESSSLTRFIFDVSPAVWLFAGAAIFFTRPTKHSYFWLVMAILSLLWASGFILDPVRLLAAALRLESSTLYSQTIYFGVSTFAFIMFMMVSWSDPLFKRPVITRIALGGALLVIVALAPALRREFPIHNVQLEPVYTMMASEPEDYLLVEYPFGLESVLDGRTLGTGSALTGSAVWHHKRTLSGVAPFYSNSIFADFEAMQFLFPEALEDDQIPAAAEELAVAVEQWRIGYVIVHPDLVGSDMQNLQALIDETTVFCSPFQSGKLTIYRARWHPVGCDQEELN